MEKRESNYEIMKRQMQTQFASYDMDKVAKDWELDQMNGYLLTDFVGRSYKINKETGAIYYEEDGQLKEADYNVSMTLFDILTRNRQYPSGRFQSSGSLSTVHLSSSGSSNGGLFKSSKEFFDHKDAELAQACQKLGGTVYGKGDVEYRIPLFKDMDLIFQFWDSDEDFEPELNFFCDSNILQFMHFETMMFMLVHVLERLRDLVKA